MNDPSNPGDFPSELDDSSSSVAVMDEAEGTAAESTGPRCEKCDAPIQSDVVAICRSCGWYASLGTFVEVDPNWETTTEAGAQTAEAAKPSHLRVWLNLLPRWSWVIIASVVAIIVESVVVRLVTPAGGGLRTTWSLCQLAAGVLAFIGCHIFNFLVAAAEDADVGLLDLVLKPLKLWMRAAQNLPVRLWVANLAVSGVTAAAASLLIIGGIPYERLWDWGFDAPVKQELMGAVMDRMKKLESRNGADNLEDAIGDFAGTADDLDETPEPAKPRDKADCIILGYQLDREGRLNSLVLGTNYLGRLVFAGRVTPKMSEEEFATLLQLLTRIRTTQPLIPLQSDTTIWVKPKFTCRVTFDHRQKGQLRDIEWDKMLGTMATP